MAVFTVVSAEALQAFLRGYECGTPVSFKGVAEGVQNSNYLLDTTAGRFILTLYEERVETAYLPYFLDLLTHLADRGQPVPRPIRDRRGVALQALCGRPACLIEFLPGVSITEPTAGDAFAGGAALGAMHRAVADFTGV
ncbi:MAG: phosphotransferase, partial [Pseudomonadota bacterium]|nr:phosphotransferase [Pseudomonadota bacterium]